MAGGGDVSVHVKMCVMVRVKAYHGERAVLMDWMACCAASLTCTRPPSHRSSRRCRAMAGTPAWTHQLRACSGRQAATVP